MKEAIVISLKIAGFMLWVFLGMSMMFSPFMLASDDKQTHVLGIVLICASPFWIGFSKYFAEKILKDI